MGTVTFSLNRRPMGAVEEFIGAVQAEEALGFEYAWIPDSQMRRPDAYILAALALQATTRIKVGPLLSNPVTRHPAVIANGAATLGLIAPGRAAVGIGAGDTAVFTVGLRPAKAAEVGRALRLARALLHGGAPDQGGRRAVPLSTRGTAELWGAASGPRAARGAGAAADVIVLRVGVRPENLNAIADACEAGAREAGRDPSELRFASIVHTLIEDDRAWARAQAGLVAAGFYEISTMTWARAGLRWNGPPIEEITAQVYPDTVHAEDIRGAAALTRFVTDEAADAFALYGDEARVAAGLRRLVDGFPRLSHVVAQPLRWTADYPSRVAAARRAAGL
ncbi:MAG TPA: LLM class flavin-dependent oxidoreductase [Dehalococcoidia bacterium]|nr:LLM class flavin-dependent oxidoreductase [Dehalococcoidia bacterium]